MPSCSVNSKYGIWWLFETTIFSMLLLLLLLGASTLLIPLIESHGKNNGQDLNLVSNSSSHQSLLYARQFAYKRYSLQLSEIAWSKRATTMHRCDWSLSTINSPLRSFFYFSLKLCPFGLSLSFFLRWCFSQALCSCGPQLITLIIHLHAKSSTGKDTWMRLQ